jgi:hypothetical protein
MRKWFTWLSVATILLAGGDTLLWVAGTRLLSSGLDSWTAQLRADGWKVSQGTRTSFGWPLTAGLAVNDIGLFGGERTVPGGVGWAAGRVVLTLSLFSPGTLVIAPEGQETLRLFHGQPVTFSADRILVYLPVWRSGRGSQADLVAKEVTGGIIGTGHPQDVRVAALSLHAESQPRDGGGVTAAMRLRAREIELPDIGKWPLGATVSSAGAVLDVVSPNLDGPGHDAASQAEAWRKGGGTVELRDVALHWGPLKLTGSALLGLDEKLQPAGTGTADVSGTAAALDALVDAGVVQAGMGATAKAVLTAMAQLPGGNAVRLPFVLRNNTVSVGQIPLARVNDVAW